MFIGRTDVEAETLIVWPIFINFNLQESETPAVQGLSFTVRPGELLAVIGPVGQHRSSSICVIKIKGRSAMMKKY